MRLALLIVGAVVAQGRVAYHEDDPQQDDATDQQWFEEARKAGLHMDDKGNLATGPARSTAWGYHPRPVPQRPS